VPDAAQRNKACPGGCCGAMGAGGAFREHLGGHAAENTAAGLALWEACVQRFHDPTNGIEVVIGPVGAKVPI